VDILRGSLRSHLRMTERQFSHVIEIRPLASGEV
jgi:hypothetical protein